MKSEFKLLGEAMLEKKLRLLPDKVQRKVTRRAVNLALTPVVKIARKLAAVRSGLLRKAIAKKVKVYRKGETVLGMVGINFDLVGEWKGKKSRPAKYAHLIEYGFRIVKGGSLKKRITALHAIVMKRVPARPFLRPAYEQGSGEMMQTLQSEMAAGISKEAMKNP